MVPVRKCHHHLSPGPTIRWQQIQRRRNFASSPSSALLVKPPVQARQHSWRIFGGFTVLCLGIGALSSQWWFPSRGFLPIINSQTFTSFTLQSKEAVSATNAIFEARADGKGDLQDVVGPLWENCIWSVQVKQPQLQVARGYTPLPPRLDPQLQADENQSLRFLIRQEFKGEVSGYLHRLGHGATLHLRGPFVHYTLDDDIDEVLFLAGGTGIAPALQVAHALQSRRPGGAAPPRVHIMWANRWRDDCLRGLDDSRPKTGFSFWSTALSLFPPAQIRPQLEEEVVSPIVGAIDKMKAASSGRLTVDYYVDAESTFIDGAAIRRFFNNTSAGRPPATARKRIVFVAGPDGFVSHLAGEKVWRNGKEVQGPLGGLLKDIKSNNWQVWKL